MSENITTDTKLSNRKSEVYANFFLRFLKNQSRKYLKILPKQNILRGIQPNEVQIIYVMLFYHEFPNLNSLFSIPCNIPHSASYKQSKYILTRPNYLPVYRIYRNGELK